MSIPLPVYPLMLSQLRRDGLYNRPTERRDGRLYDVISDAPMATEFAISRFLTVHLARRYAGKDRDYTKQAGWALFMDCDMLILGNVCRLFEQADDSKALMVVKHDHVPATSIKMDGQQQTGYARKNWSSVMMFNLDHPANDRLTVDLVNTARGLHLHQFCWLPEDDIGELPIEWNWLAGYSNNTIAPQIVHHTDGVPFMPGYENAPYAEQWRRELERALQ